MARSGRRGSHGRARPIAASVTLEGRSYHAVKPGPEQERISRVVRAAVRESGLDVATDGTYRVSDPEKGLRILEQGDAEVSDQLRLLLVDDRGAPPAADVLERLDARVAVKLLRWLLEAVAPATPATRDRRF